MTGTLFRGRSGGAYLSPIGQASTEKSGCHYFSECGPRDAAAATPRSFAGDLPPVPGNYLAAPKRLTDATEDWVLPEAGPGGKPPGLLLPEEGGK